MKTLKLFNAVLSKDSDKLTVITEDGYIIESNALWAEKDIIAFYKEQKLSGNDLNKTFHKSWSKIKESTRYELYIEQIAHYISTYFSNFNDEVYIPNEVLSIPDLKLSYKVIKAYTKEQMTEKCLSLLQSGIALKEETLSDVLSVLVEELSYTFTGDENIRNKEAIIKIADLYNVYPKDTMEFFRYIIYRTTNDTLLIKNDKMLEAIKQSTFNPSLHFTQHGLDKLATIFNRFKPLFLAYKGKCPKTINRIGKLSKKYHKPMVSNPLNDVTNTLLTKEDLHWLNNATPFALFKALSALYSRINGQDTFAYRVRNGKSYAKTGNGNSESLLTTNFDTIIDFIKTKYDLGGKKFFLPKDVKYALPTSEKMFVGNIPTGTRFYADKMAVGVYWENAYGANDIDLSALNIGGKVGWNSTYNQGQGSLMYSGDIRNAPNGAVEYLYANKGLNAPSLATINIYSGNDVTKYKIIIGKGDKMSREYMMNPNNLILDVMAESVQKQNIFGIIIPKKDKQCFVLLNFGAGQARVSGCGEVTDLFTKALYQQWNKPLSLNKLLKILDATVVDEDEIDENTIDLSLDKLNKDSFINIFK